MLLFKFQFKIFFVLFFHEFAYPSHVSISHPLLWLAYFLEPWKRITNPNCSSISAQNTLRNSNAALSLWLSHKNRHGKTCVNLSTKQPLPCKIQALENRPSSRDWFQNLLSPHMTWLSNFLSRCIIYGNSL